MRSLTRLIDALLLDPTSNFFSAGMKASSSRQSVRWPSNMFSSTQISVPEVFREFSRTFLIQAISLFKRLSAVLSGIFAADAKASNRERRRKYSDDWPALSVAAPPKTVKRSVMKNRIGCCSPEHLKIRIGCFLYFPSKYFKQNCLLGSVKIKLNYEKRQKIICLKKPKPKPNFIFDAILLL